MTNTYKNWLLKEDDKIATLTLNRAEHKNSLTAETFYELREITAYLAEQRDVWAVVLEAAGEHFSVGVDVNVIGLMIGQDEGVYREKLRELQGCLDVFEQLEKPIIAKLHGYCLGGGLLLALCCDFRLASANTQFGLPEVKRSIAVLLGTKRITRLAGLAATKQMILLADKFGPRIAHSYNLIHRIVPDAELDEAVTTLATKFKHLPPRAVAIAKRIIDQGYEMSLRESQDLEIESQLGLLDSPDFQEAISSFFEKRPPVYTGF